MSASPSHFRLLRSIIWLSIILPIGLIAAQVPQPIMTRFTYAAVSGQDTAWQYVIRSPGHFQTDLLIPKQGASVKIAAVADSGALVRLLDLDVWMFPAGATDAKWTHLQHGTYELAADSVLGIARGERGEQSQRFPAAPGSIIFQWNYVALLEQLVLRARTLGGSTAEVPAYFFGTAGFTLSATVRFPPGTDSAIVSLGQSEYRVLLDKYNRIESATSRNQEIRRVARRLVFQSDSTITQDLRCPEGALGNDLAAIRADVSVNRVLSLYPGARQARGFRALKNDSDLAACKEILDMFPPQGVVPQLLELGDVYLMVVRAPGQRARVGIISHDLSVTHVITTAPLSEGASN